MDVCRHVGQKGKPAHRGELPEREITGSIMSYECTRLYQVFEKKKTIIIIACLLI